MRVIPIRTGKILPGTQMLEEVLDAYAPPLKEGSVIAVTSKIVSICEGRFLPVDGLDKKKLAFEEADYYIERWEDGGKKSPITVKNGVLMTSAGIDISNGNGNFIFWPADPQKSANACRAFLRKKFLLKDLGVVITDTKSQILRRGTVGTAIAHSGFKALKRYIGIPDVFGRPLHSTNSKNIAEGLAIAAVFVMGEANEQTPLAIIEDIPFVEFQKRNPSKKEVAEVHFDMKYDFFSTILVKADWKKGKGGIMIARKPE